MVRVLAVPLVAITLVACSSDEGASGTTAEETRNLAVVEGFFRGLVTNKDPLEVGRYLRDDFVSNEPMIAGKQGMMDFATFQAKNNPNANFVDVIHTVAKGDLVIKHYTFANDPAKGADFLIVDFLRLEDGLIVEYWDVVKTPLRVGG